MFSKRRKSPSCKYTSDQIKKRNEDIPSLDSKTLGFEFEDLFSFEKKTRPIPASIHYLSSKYLSSKESISKSSKKLELPTITEKELEISHSDEPTFDVSVAQHGGHLEQLLQEPVTPDSEFSHIPLASQEKVEELQSLHVSLYSLLSKVQEIQISIEFKTAYDIQDKISYLLNHENLLFADMVDKLIIYLQSVIEKMEIYYVDIQKKQKTFQFYSQKISSLKEYKFKTDESMKIIDEHKNVALSEIERNSLILSRSS